MKNVPTNLNTIDALVPEFNISQDLQKLNNEISKEKILPLGKEKMKSVINFIKTNGEKEGLYAIYFNLPHNGNIYKIKFINRDIKNPKISIEGDTNISSYVTDNHGKIIIPNQIRAGIKLRGLQNGITPAKRLEKYQNNQQRTVNKIFENLINYY